MMEQGKCIGGYFELEITSRKTFLHYDGILLNTGRNALEYILTSIGKIECLYIPYFTCSVILEPIEKLGVKVKRYSINDQLQLIDDIILLENEYLLYTNYFGIQSNYCKNLFYKYKNKLILDNAQAYFTPPILDSYTFYSPRKFVGVPDGGIVYLKNGLSLGPYEQDYSWDRCVHLLKRCELHPSEGYVDFKETNKNLSHLPIRKMSLLTQKLLYSIDFEDIKRRRAENFLMYHNEFSNVNKLKINATGIDSPLIYPLWLDNGADLKAFLIKQQIYCATYWPNVIEDCYEDMLEVDLAKNIISLPIDQRYNDEDIISIINLIKSYGF